MSKLPNPPGTNKYRRFTKIFIPCKKRDNRGILANRECNDHSNTSMLPFYDKCLLFQNMLEHQTSILLKETRVFAKFDQFLPVRSHFDTKRPVNFFHIATFPSPTFGPLFAFHCPSFFTKNNNLECRDVLKTVTVTSDQKRSGPYTAHN